MIKMYFCIIQTGAQIGGQIGGQIIEQILLIKETRKDMSFTVIIAHVVLVEFYQ